MISKPIPYGRQHITDEDIRAVIDTLKSDYLTQGPKIREFETKFAEYVGAQYAVAVNNATSGLHLAATALNVKPGDKVIVTPMTFAASANCIRYCGGQRLSVIFGDRLGGTIGLEQNGKRAGCSGRYRLGDVDIYRPSVPRVYKGMVGKGKHHISSIDRHTRG